MTIIILEGPDGQGKTTLAKLLCEKYNGKYFHSSFHTKMAYMLEDYILSIWIAILKAQMGGNLVVVDRYILSCEIYDKIYRNENATISKNFAKHMYRRLYNNKAVQFIVNHSESLAVAYFIDAKNKRNEMYESVTDFRKLRFEFAKRCKLNTDLLTVPVERTNFDDVIKLVGKLLEKNNV